MDQRAGQPAEEAAAVDGDAARGAQLVREGRFGEAEQLLRRALERRPADATIAALLVRILLMQKKSDAAGAVIEAALAAGAALPAELLRLRGQLLLASSRFADAIAAFEHAIADTPDDAAAELGLAVALSETQANEAAAGTARRAIAKGLDTPAARFVLGRALFGCGRFDEAEAEFRAVVHAQPSHANAHANLADVVWMQTGDLKAATAEIDAALGKAPQLVALQTQKARLLEAALGPAAAYASVAEALQRSGNSIDLHIAAAQMSIAFDGARALAHAEQALRQDPRHRAAQDVRADALLAVGDAARVIAAVDPLLRADPDDGHAIALLASAWRMLGDARYAELYDYARVVRPAPIDTPEGWPDLATYLRDLAANLHRRHDAMRAHPLRQTLRSGTQIELRLRNADDAPIRAFPQAIEGCVKRYLDAIGSGTDLLRRRNTGAWRLQDIWSVRLRESGFHHNHFHGRGWLSSACYIELPSLDDVAGAGWLQFGAPRMPTVPVLEPDFFVRPEAGLLVLFPSWMWHGTVPFAGSGDRTRLTVAFDVVPVRSA